MATFTRLYNDIGWYTQSLPADVVALSVPADVVALSVPANAQESAAEISSK